MHSRAPSIHTDVHAHAPDGIPADAARTPDGIHPDLASRTTLGGQALIFRLFLLLALATALVMVLYLRTGPAATVRQRLAFATAGDLAAPVLGWWLLKAIAAWQTPERSRLLWIGAGWTVATFVGVFAVLRLLGLAG